jgi:predicted regulator of Ras-like GTPase activity (Roadblock/LC7/MglB family)
MLSTLVERAPGARGAVVCDYEGEFVELVVRDSALSEYEMRIFGAQIAAAWLDLGRRAAERGAGGIVEMRLGCAGGTLLCRALRDRYDLVLLIARGSPSALAAFEMEHAATEISPHLL